MSYKAALVNQSSFSAGKIELPDAEGQLAVLIVATATFVDAGEEKLRPAPEHAPIRWADVYDGVPGKSAIRFESDVALEKPAVDVVVSGNAHAPGGRPAESVEVALEVGKLRKRLTVSGDRRWLATGRPSRPEPFMVMPIVYERAFGGSVHGRGEAVTAADGRNLVGVGFRAARSGNPRVTTDIANVEYPDERITSASDAPRPAGFGVVSRGWSPRRELAGTFDQAWLDERWPFMPRDFSPRHNQSVPPDQQLAEVLGGEEVRLEHMTPEGTWSFRLPRPTIPCLLCFADRWEQRELRMDTFCIEPEYKRVSVTSRLAIRLSRRRGDLREIVLGRSPGRQRAIDEGKQYAAFGSRDIVST